MLGRSTHWGRLGCRDDREHGWSERMAGVDGAVGMVGVGIGNLHVWLLGIGEHGIKQLVLFRAWGWLGLLWVDSRESLG